MSYNGSKICPMRWLLVAWLVVDIQALSKDIQEWQTLSTSS